MVNRADSGIRGFADSRIRGFADSRIRGFADSRIFKIQWTVDQL